MVSVVQIFASSTRVVLVNELFACVNSLSSQVHSSTIFIGVDSDKSLALASFHSW